MNATFHRILFASVGIIFILLLVSCAAAPPPNLTPEPPGSPHPADALRDFTATPSTIWTRTPTAFRPPTNTPTITPTPVPTERPTLAPDAWMSLPIIPAEVSPTVKQIYARGLELGNNPQAFSKIGDCEAVATWFLKDFDLGERYYNLGSYTNLQAVIDYYKGSYQREGMAAKAGFTAASALSPLWADPYKCEKGETPLECEYRLNKPALAFIILGTNDHNSQKTFEPNLRKIIEISIQDGVIPVLVTKADNLEGDNSLNAIIASLANEYDVPLWNFWAAVQPLPSHGLQTDGAHLTFYTNDFSDPEALNYAWPVRNLGALQMLDLLMNGLAQ